MIEVILSAETALKGSCSMQTPRLVTAKGPTSYIYFLSKMNYTLLVSVQLDSIQVIFLCIKMDVTEKTWKWNQTLSVTEKVLLYILICNSFSGILENDKNSIIQSKELRTWYGSVRSILCTKLESREHIQNPCKTLIKKTV